MNDPTQCTREGCSNTAIPPDYLVCPKHKRFPGHRRRQVTRVPCKHMLPVELPNGRTVMLDKLSECEEALRSVEAQNEQLRSEIERLRQDRCTHPSSSGIDQTEGPDKVWECDNCGWLHRVHVEGGISQDVGVIPASESNDD